jgi:N-carbamoylputrescine amidase
MANNTPPLRIAAAQFGSTNDKQRNLEKFRAMAARARDLGASIVCFPELCNTTYFCWESNPALFGLAEPIPGPTTAAVGDIAREMGLTILCSVYECAGPDYFNSTFIVNARGEMTGLYRKNSIPLSVGKNGVNANEKMYFRPGNLGFPVFDTDYGIRLGILICYDRHFPEAARVLALGGADILFVPTATWREPMRWAWELELRAHAFANAYYVCGVNKVSLEEGGSPTNRYFGCSLIVSPRGEIVVQAGTEGDEVVVADFDRDLLEEQRRLWPVFRDRRPDLYGPLTR